MIKDNVPKYLYNEPTLNKIYKSQQDELDLIEANNKIIENNFFIDTANSDGLTVKEKELGLYTDINDTLENRRSRIKAKKRSIKKFTLHGLKEMAKSFSNGEIEPIPNWEEDEITIKFVGTVGVPPKIEDLYKAIEDYKPAWIEIKYEFSYNTWGDIKNNNWTWGEFKDNNFTWNDLKSSNNIKR